MASSPLYPILQKKLHYTFKANTLLQVALTHRSFSAHNNERLEFLGDALLNLVVAEMLFHAYPQENEGTLSRLRSALIKEDTLKKIGEALNLKDYLRLGQGELKNHGLSRPSILADTMEALFAAIYLDGGYTRAQAVIYHLYEQRVQEINLEEAKDAKSRLQELLQKRHLPLPVYRIESQSGAAHAQTFVVSCTISALNLHSQAKGQSRKKAETAAAAALLPLVHLALEGHHAL